MAGRILRVEGRHTFITRKGVNGAVLLDELLGSSSELFKSFRRMILLLQQVGITHEPFRLLRERAQKARKDSRRLCGVSRIEEAIELHSVVLCREGRLV